MNQQEQGARLDERLDPLDGSAFDVVVCGGGLAGLTLGRQLRREHPALRVAVIEKTERPLPPGCHKVGESSVELGSQYLER
ncbi:MAG TPA: lycopene cyclase family protein, partial [Polyangiales bacterium]